MTTNISTPSAAFLAGLTLHPVQARFVASRARFACFVGGQRQEHGGGGACPGDGTGSSW